MGGRHTRPVPPLELTVRGRGVCGGGGGPWVSGKRCSARDPRGCAPQSRFGAGRCRWLRFFPVLPLPRFHAPSPLGWLCPAEIWGTRSPCADDPLRGRSPPTRSGCSDKGCAPAAAAKRVDSMSAFPTQSSVWQANRYFKQTKAEILFPNNSPSLGRGKERPQDREQGNGRGAGAGTRNSRIQRRPPARERASPGRASLFSPLSWRGPSGAAVRGAGAGAARPPLRAGLLHCSCAGRASVRVCMRVCATVCVHAAAPQFARRCCPRAPSRSAAAPPPRRSARARTSPRL